LVAGTARPVNPGSGRQKGAVQDLLAAAAEAAEAEAIALRVVKSPGAERGFVLRPRRWLVERSFA